jgi:hypothetical protein
MRGRNRLLSLGTDNQTHTLNACILHRIFPQKTSIIVQLTLAMPNLYNQLSKG